MKTEQLIALLAADAGPVPRHVGEKRLALALAVGLPLALLWVLAQYGLRPDLAQVLPSAAFALKIGVPLLMAACALVLLFRLAHPGARLGAWPVGLVLPALLWWGLAATTLWQADAGERAALVWGQTWRVCVVNLAVTALPLGVALFWALKGLAPTRPALAGAAAGWLAGALAAVVYALHCAEMAMPFLAVWYLLGMAVCAGVGALVAWQRLRW